MSESTNAHPATHGLAVASRFIDPPVTRMQKAWLWLSERTNPIVVKEARQSLNSSQFVICFTLMLLAIVFWTVISLFSQLPNAYYLPSGLLVVTGYFVILSFPLVLVIPFSAFRSMVTEAESRTFELVSISALSARQIVMGKMASACLQLVIYLSGMTPCIVITYLLRGIALHTILVYLYFAIMVSVLATALSILIATMTRSRLLQVFSSILVLGGLLILFYFACVVTVTAVYTFPAIEAVTMPWLVFFGTIVLTTIPICLRCASASIDFPSENHALAIRVLLLIWFGTIFFWLMWLILSIDDSLVLLAAYSIVLGLFLFVGSLVVSEKGVLSPRAQRTLPRTLLGKLFFTWFYPGAGMGYVFLTCLMVSFVITTSVLAQFYSVVATGFRRLDHFMAIGYLTICYFVFYTGMTRLFLYFTPRASPGRWLIGIIIQSLGLAFGCLGPFVAVLLLNEFRPFEHDWHQAFNIPWTITEIESKGLTTNNVESLIAVSIPAFVVFLINFWTCSRDVLLLRISLPPRMQTDTENAPKSIETTVHPLDSAS
jgi:hypothetical protein